MVRPEDYIKQICDDDIDFAIIDYLYTDRNHSPRSARELTHALKHLFPAKKQEHAERTLRNHLSKLCLSNILAEAIREPTGERGRAPYTYHLADGFKVKMDDFLNKKEIKLAAGIAAAIRCNKPPVECPDSSCKICQANNIKTRWD